MNELSEFLNDHYVEAPSGNFRLAYFKEFLQYAYTFPGWKSDYQLAIRNSKNKKLMASIMFIPHKLKTWTDELWCAQVNFAVVHRKLRLKKLG